MLKFSSSLFVLLVGLQICRADPIIKSLKVQTQPPIGDSSPLLGIRTYVASLVFAQPIKAIAYHVTLYTNGDPAGKRLQTMSVNGGTRATFDNAKVALLIDGFAEGLSSNVAKRHVLMQLSTPSPEYDLTNAQCEIAEDDFHMDGMFTYYQFSTPEKPRKEMPLFALIFQDVKNGKSIIGGVDFSPQKLMKDDPKARMLVVSIEVE